MSQLESDPRVVIYTPRERFWEREHTRVELLFGPGLRTVRNCITAFIVSLLAASGLLIHHQFWVSGIGSHELLTAGVTALLCYVLSLAGCASREYRHSPFMEEYHDTDAERRANLTDLIAFVENQVTVRGDANPRVIGEYWAGFCAENQPDLGIRLYADQKLEQYTRDADSGDELESRLRRVAIRNTDDEIVASVAIAIGVFVAVLAHALVVAVGYALLVVLIYATTKIFSRICRWRIAPGRITGQKDRVWRAGEAVMRIRLDNFTGKRAQAAVLGPAGYSTWVFNLRSERDRDRLRRLIALWLADS